MLMRSVHTCNKGSIAFYLLIILIVLLLLGGMTACASKPAESSATEQAQNSEAPAAVSETDAEIPVDSVKEQAVPDSEDILGQAPVPEAIEEPTVTVKEEQIPSITVEPEDKAKYVNEVAVNHGDYIPADNDDAQDVESSDDMPEDSNPNSEDPMETNNTARLKIQINGTDVAVTWDDNESVTALKELASSPITVQMSMYGGFEQVGPLGTSLPRNDLQTTTSAGDIVLYSGNQIVVFYGSNSWAYTRLGRVELSAAEMSELLSNGDVSITLYME